MIKIDHIQFASPVRVGSSTNHNYMSTKHNKDMLIEWDGESKFYITHLPSKKQIVVFSTNVAFAEMFEEVKASEPIAPEVISGRLQPDDISGTDKTKAVKKRRRKVTSI